MLYEFKKTFVKLLVIGLVITECLILLERISVLSSDLPFSSCRKTASTSKVEYVPKESLQHVEQSFKAANGYENDKNGRSEETGENGRMSRQGPKIWDQWGKWSSCSVTCGIGKIARWRHCIDGSCFVGEKKAQLKTCTLAAC